MSIGNSVAGMKSLKASTIHRTSNPYCLEEKQGTSLKILHVLPGEFQFILKSIIATMRKTHDSQNRRKNQREGYNNSNKTLYLLDR